MSPREHIIHLVQDNDRTTKSCDGTPYISPQSRGAIKPGDIVRLCHECVKPIWKD